VQIFIEPRGTVSAIADKTGFRCFFPFFLARVYAIFVTQLNLRRCHVSSAAAIMTPIFLIKVRTSDACGKIADDPGNPNARETISK